MSDLLAALNEDLSGRYRLDRELGRGGMATVYIAADLRHDRNVAIKVFQPEFAAALGADRFLREIRITAQLNHPNVLPLLDSGRSGDSLFYVMPLIEGESLRHRLDRERQLPVAIALRITAEVAEALHHAHERGFVHRDIKPENILLSSDHAVVADFGIARAISAAATDRLTDSGLAIGTPVYMSPEQASGDAELNGRSDVYALGCVLFEMLAGEPPFSGPTAQAIVLRHLSERVPSIRVLRPAIPRSLEEAVFTALAKVPADRFATAKQFADSLFIDAGPTVVIAASPPTAANLPNRGPMVSRMCNRWRQVNEFEAFMRGQRQRAPGRPQLCIVHGAEGSGHSSFVERVVATRIQHSAEEQFGTEGAAVRRVSVPWPTTGDLDVRKRDLMISLFREIDPSYLGEELTIARLTALPTLALAAGVIVEHDLRAKRWDAAADQLLEWYARTFWGAMPPAQRTQAFFVFFKMVYDESPSGLQLTRLFGMGQRRTESVRKSLEAIATRVSADCPCLMLQELSTVTVDDVKDWFTQHQIHDSEHKRQKLAEQIFGGDAVKPMAAVEDALTRIHKSFLNELALEQRRAR